MQTFKKPLSIEEEAYYLEKSKAGDIVARNILVEYNLRLVAHIVKKYSSPYRDTEDLISIGTIGLIKAINTYDKDKGSRLVTYASRCIENELLMKMRKERKQSKEVSLYESIGNDKEGNEINLLDIISSDENEILNNIISKKYLEQIHSIFYVILDKREQLVLSMRYGLNNYNHEYTQKQVAEILDISRSYVSRIEKKALAKLHSALL